MESLRAFVSDERILQLLSDLIRIDSVNPSLVPGGRGEVEIAHRLGEYMQGIGLEVRYQEFLPGRPNVIGILKGTGGGKSVMLNGHIDTVNTAGMDIDPLYPRFEDGKVYGRGSFDMKGGVAAMVEAVAAIAGSGRRLRGDVIVTGVGDEEYASAGTEAIVREYKADAAINCEPTGLDLVLAHKGFAWMRTTVEGKAAHGSLPWEGVDAITKAARFLVELEKMASEEFPKRTHPLVGSGSVHASLISGGAELSTYPSKCVVELERRTIPGEDRDTVVREMEALLGRISAADPQFRARNEVFFYRPSFEVSPKEPIVQALQKACVEVFGQEPAHSGTSPWLDSAILKDAGIPTAVFGPLGGGAHSAVEWVDFRSVVDTARVLYQAIANFCG
ncbi:MAG: ArgE/DapE family deacylase [Bacillota bacterium]